MHTKQREMYASLHINVCAVHMRHSCVWTRISVTYLIHRKKKKSDFAISYFERENEATVPWNYIECSDFLLHRNQ